MKMQRELFTISEAEYLRLRDEYGGICLACGELAEDGVEPDAEGYVCESCGEPRVVGIEQALLMGHLDIQ